MNSDLIYSNLVALVMRKIPQFEVRFKDENRFQRALGFVVGWFNPEYMTEFTTTLFPCVYFPNRPFVVDNSETAWKILAHEYVHLCDTQDSPVLFRLRYLMPQIISILSLLAVLAFWIPWMLLFLVTLIFLIPWPSQGRSSIESRGYAMSLAVDYWTEGTPISKESKDWVTQQFLGWAYYRMGTSKIFETVESITSAIESGAILSGPKSEPYMDVYLMLTALGAVRILRA
jgi:hypothetical protein